ncbi:MAG: YybS family protein [Firmicutes bacterium]|nr:YybS family protein [Bacillota bacterium]
MTILKNQRVVEFSAFSAAFVLPALATVFIPPMAILTILFMPIPLALMVRRLDLRYGLATFLATVVILFLLTGRPQSVLFLAFQTGPLGILLGLIFKNHVSAGRALAVTVGFSLAAAVVILASSYFVTGANPLVLSERDRQVFDIERKMISDMVSPGGPAQGLDPEGVREMEKVIAQVEAMWPVLATSSIMIWFMVSAAITFSFTRYAMARYGYRQITAVPFSRWRLPWYVIWGVIGGLAFLLAGDESNINELALAGKSMLWVMGFVFSVMGMSVATFFLGRWKASWPIKLAVTVALGIYLPFTVSVLVALGLIDSILNVRRLSADGRIPEEVDKK